jgi:hypothetical protein
MTQFKYTGELRVERDLNKLLGLDDAANREDLLSDEFAELHWGYASSIFRTAARPALPLFP